MAASSGGRCRRSSCWRAAIWIESLFCLAHKCSPRRRLCLTSMLPLPHALNGNRLSPRMSSRRRPGWASLGRAKAQDLAAIADAGNHHLPE
jgi:hypothetical protein